jgi:hypothetical protein
MKINIEYEFIKHNIDSGKSVLEIPFSLVFLTKENVRLQNLFIKNYQGTINSILIYPESSEEQIKFPKTFEKKEFHKKNLKIKIFFNSLLKGKTAFDLLFQFDYNEESNSNVLFKSEINITENNSIQVIKFKKYNPWTQYVGMTLIALILLTAYIWNYYNKNVYREEMGIMTKILTDPTSILSILSALTLFLGINLKETMKMFRKGSALVNFIGYLEFYVEPTLLNMIRKKGWLIFLLIFTFIEMFLAYSFWPIELSSLAGSKLSYYYKREISHGKYFYKELAQNKIYRYYGNKIEIGIKKYLCVDTNLIVPIGNLEYGFYKGRLNPYNFYYCDFCSDLASVKSAVEKDLESLQIIDIVNNPVKPYQDDIYDYLRGVRDTIDYYQLDNRNIFFKKGVKNRIDPTKIISLLDNFYKENESIVEEYFNSDRDYNYLQKEYIENAKINLENIYRRSKVDQDDIKNSYQYLAKFIIDLDSNKQIDRKEICKNLVHIKALFEASNKYIRDATFPCNIISEDFKNFYTPKNNKRIKENFNYNIEELYLDLLAYLSTLEYRKKCDFLSSINDVYNISKQYQISINADSMQEIQNEKDFRNNLLELIYISSARNKIDSNIFHKIFTETENIKYLKDKMNYIIAKIDTNKINKYYKNFFTLY